MEPLQPQPAWAPLTPAQIARYDENGFCTMPAVLDAEAVAAVTRACDRHMEEWGPKTQPDFPINFYANRYTPLLSDPALQALPSHPAVLTAAVQLLRSVEIKLSQAQLTYKFPQDPAATPVFPDGDGNSYRNWHRDLNNFGPHEVLRGKSVSLRVGIALTDMTTPNSGVTMLVPGSHKLLDQIRLPEDAVDPVNAISPLLKAGDVLLFSASCYHTPDINTRPEIAKLLLVTFTYRMMATTVVQPPPPEIMATLTPIETQVDYGGRPILEGEDSCPVGTWAKEFGGYEQHAPPMRLLPNGKAHL